jgi:hypothetical protein
MQLVADIAAQYNVNTCVIAYDKDPRKRQAMQLDVHQEELHGTPLSQWLRMRVSVRTGAKTFSNNANGTNVPSDPVSMRAFSATARSPSSGLINTTGAAGNEGW